MKISIIKSKIKTLITVTVSCLLFSCQTEEKVTLYFNAEVITMAEEGGVVGAMAVQSGVIVGIGSYELLKSQFPKASQVDLEGKTVIPGIVDSHVHAHEFGQQTLKANLEGTTTVDEMVERLRVFFPNPAKGEWLLGFGWDEGEWASIGYPDRAALDLAFPDNPVKLQALHGFAGFYNGKALEIAGIDSSTPEPEVGAIIRRENGEPTGVLETSAQQLVNRFVPEETVDDAKRAILSGLEKLKSKGIAAVHEAGVTKTSLQAYQELDDANLLPIRVYGMLNGNDDEMMEEWFEKGPEMDLERKFFVKGIKVFYDGSLGSRTALLFAPYADNPKAARMTERISISKIKNLAFRATEKEFQLAIHAIGDLGNDRILDVYEEAIQRKPFDHRWRLEHAQVVYENFYSRASDLGIWVSMQSSHAVGDRNWAEDRLGPTRIKHAYAWRNMLDHKVPFILNSDMPGEPWEPMQTLYFGVTRMDLEGNPPTGWYSTQALTAEEALRAMTLDGAKSAFMEEMTGSLEVGKFADFVILSDNPLKVEPSKIKEIQVERIFVQGK
ncbi:amidohydrolase [Belliella sp. R4-6]|uniref:Amidohydrolase n=1 Tax=Belliella alkalica TaxID=1730871 RepID=A0ABS9VB13_9BACT|nr:amidohydrolase [Belliella alkalica]MCH7413621.1 amidohydrolase [Belliella alkalica]